MDNMKFVHIINTEGVRNFCIHNNLYTIGDNEDYAKMLETVSEANDCTPQLIVAIAKDIAKHSDEQDSKINLSFENIAFYLCEDVMYTSLELDD